LEKNIKTNIINWNGLSANPNAIHLLEQNLDKVEWKFLSCNSNAIHLLEQNMDKIKWNFLCSNESIFINENEYFLK
jgi:hypothetical protein